MTVDLDAPRAGHPSWFLRVECERCGMVVLVTEAHARWRDRMLADILRRMRHDVCDGLAAERGGTDNR